MVLEVPKDPRRSRICELLAELPPEETAEVAQAYIAKGEVDAATTVLYGVPQVWEHKQMNSARLDTLKAWCISRAVMAQMLHARAVADTDKSTAGQDKSRWGSEGERSFQKAQALFESETKQVLLPEQSRREPLESYGYRRPNKAKGRRGWVIGEVLPAHLSARVFAQLLRHDVDGAVHTAHVAMKAQKVCEREDRVEAMEGTPPLAYQAAACAAFQRGDYEDALEKFQYTLQHCKLSGPAVRLGIGVCALKLRRTDLAKKAFLRVLQIEATGATAVRAYHGLAQLSLLHAADADDDLRELHLVEAQQWVQRGLRVDSNDARLLLLQGRLLDACSVKDVEEAGQLLENDSDEDAVLERAQLLARQARQAARDVVTVAQAYLYQAKALHRRAARAHTRQIAIRVLQLKKDSSVDGEAERGKVQLEQWLSKASDQYKQCLARDPSMVEARLGLGQVLCWQERFPEAIPQLRQFTQARRGHVSALRLLSACHAKMEEHAPSLRYAHQAVQYSTGGDLASTIGTLYEYSALAALHEPRQALTAAQEAARQACDPDNAGAMWQCCCADERLMAEVDSDLAWRRDHLLEGTQDADPAELRRRFAVLRVRTHLQNNVAAVMFRCGKLHEAAKLQCATIADVVQHFYRGTPKSYDETKPWRRLVPQYTPVYYNLARIREELGQLDMATRLYASVLLVSPSYAEAVLRQGIMSMRSGFDSRAEKRFLSVAEKSDSPDARLLLASLYKEQHRYDQAKEQYKKVLLRRKDDAYAMVAIGALYVQMARQSRYRKDTQKRVDLLRKAAAYFVQVAKSKIHNRNVYAFCGLAAIEFDCGYLDEAEGILSEIREMLGDARQLPTVWMHLGHIYLARGNHNQSVAMFERVLSVLDEAAVHAQGEVDASHGQIGMGDFGSNFRVDVLLHLSKALFSGKNFRQASDRLQQALLLRPQRNDLWFQLALSSERHAVQVINTEADSKDVIIKADDVRAAMQHLRQAESMFRRLEKQFAASGQRGDSEQCRQHAKYCHDCRPQAEKRLKIAVKREQSQQKEKQRTEQRREAEKARQLAAAEAQRKEKEEAEKERMSRARLAAAEKQREVSDHLASSSVRQQRGRKRGRAKRSYEATPEEGGDMDMQEVAELEAELNDETLFGTGPKKRSSEDDLPDVFDDEPEDAHVDMFDDGDEEEADLGVPVKRRRKELDADVSTAAEVLEAEEKEEEEALPPCDDELQSAMQETARQFVSGLSDEKLQNLTIKDVRKYVKKQRPDLKDALKTHKRIFKKIVRRCVDERDV